MRILKFGLFASLILATTAISFLLPTRQSISLANN